ncbi:hypothetical protein WMY93_028344 [Mugilogobius chulae]|uniref:Uncharacterized protein n=1 Tax=Mugilogobius chulae TaxID=88201 RepID=A0AAW0MP32_9GOBI
MTSKAGLGLKFRTNTGTCQRSSSNLTDLFRASADSCTESSLVETQDSRLQLHLQDCSVQLREDGAELQSFLMETTRQSAVAQEEPPEHMHKPMDICYGLNSVSAEFGLGLFSSLFFT